jgi:hypothetical protein
MTDPPAADLGALRKRVDLAIAWLNGDLTYVPKDWTPSEAGPDVAVLRAAYDAQAARLAAAEQARDDCSTSTYELLGELLAAHQITPEPCPGGPCVANALLAIGHALTAAEAERDQARADAADAMLAHGLAVEALRHVEAECKRERVVFERRDRQLAALETAAIAYRAWFIAYDGLEGNLAVGHRLLTELRQVTAALDAPDGSPS